MKTKYMITIEKVPSDPMKGGRISAFREAGKLFDKLAENHKVGFDVHTVYKQSSCKMFALMEQEIGK